MVDSSSHPVPPGRRAALHDQVYWVPMAGIVSRIAASFGLDPEIAGDIITTGMAAGTIGHKAVTGDDWIVSPRGAEIIRRSGFSYETMLDWRTGCLVRQGASPVPIMIYWPDVERAARAMEADSATVATKPSPSQQNQPGKMDVGPRRTGTAGRPSSADLMLAELRDVAKRGQLATALTQQATNLLAWLKANHPAEPCPKVKSLRAKIGDDFRRLKQAENNRTT